MLLTIVIVNYNVRHFLDQCLRSVFKALEGIEAEVFVVDNNSVDGSAGMIRKHFPEVKLIVNKKNIGFAAANNIALRQAKGQYALLLNPDTVVQEDTFRSILGFMESHPDAGGLGVQMVNGKGEFLPESKRALPTPWVAFYKVFGLSRLFPNSKTFGRYHLTFLDKNQTHAVEVLSGAFMLLRKSVLDEIGLLDEDYFMYGEDIDLSYRIIQAGYKNYYFPGTKIIHYKGESTKKGSLNYVLVFYKAMMIFAHKHFSANRRRAFMFLIQCAIYLRMTISISRRLVDKRLLPLWEFATFGAITAGSYWTWQRYNINPLDNTLDFESLLPYWTYSSAFVGGLWLMGAYKKPYKVRPVVAGIFTAFIAIATISFMTKDTNMSRAVVVLATAGTVITALLNRTLFNLANTGTFFMDDRARKRMVIVGEGDEVGRVVDLLENTIYYPAQFVGVVSETQATLTPDLQPLGDLAQLEDIVRFYDIQELVFCNASLTTHDIIATMSKLSNSGLSFKIVPPQADYLVGPNVIFTSTRLQTGILKLARRENRIKKKIFDVVVSTGLLVLFPVTFWLYRRPWRALALLLYVVGGNYHLVGYIDGTAPDLPPLKAGLLNLQTLIPQSTHPSRLDMHYARHYSVWLDWQILWRGLVNLGNSSL